MTKIIQRQRGNAPVVSFGNLVDHFFQNTPVRFWDDDFTSFRDAAKKGSVPVNVKETDKQYEVAVIAPGLKKEDFRIHVQDDRLTVSFEHQEEDAGENKDNGWIRKEYRQQSFSRSFTLDDTVDAGKIDARYNDGILLLNLPKKEGTAPVSKTIEVQ